MSKRTGFFDLLRSRLERTPDRAFDQRFWSKFDAEFGRGQELTRSKLTWRIWLPGLVAACGVVLLAISLRSPAPEPPQSIAQAIEEASVALAVQDDSELLGNLDLYEELEVLPINDEDWDILLGEDPAV